MTANEKAKALMSQVLEEAAARRLPASTYRLQLNAEMPFARAREILSYLAQLGVTDVYTSPCFLAKPSSAHGYDVLDFGRVWPELGGDVAHEAFGEELKRLGLGRLLDMVPNHMGIFHLNPYFWDVLENGPSSVFAEMFDIDFEPQDEALRHKVLLPLLGAPFGEVLERGEITLSYHEGAFSVGYFEHHFPLALEGYVKVLEANLERFAQTMEDEPQELAELQSILTSLRHLPGRDEVSPSRKQERFREKEIIKRRLAGCTWRSSRTLAFVLSNVREFNGEVGRCDSFNRMEQLLATCCFRLAFWKVAAEEINYRRFFDINELAAVCVEREEVFERLHAKVFEWVGKGWVTGLRVDHPDGLLAPGDYFTRLQKRFVLERARVLSNVAADDWPSVENALNDVLADWKPDRPLPFYVVIEKIQGGQERMPDAFCVDGSISYRFANQAAGLLVDARNEQVLTAGYENFIGRHVAFDRLLNTKKKDILQNALVSELNVLALRLHRLARANRHSRDLTHGSLRRALMEVVAAFPVYRTYLEADCPHIDARDAAYIRQAIDVARQLNPELGQAVFGWLERLLLLEEDKTFDSAEHLERVKLAMKFQQLTSPVMAKALEDTSFYVYNRLVSLNEVGGEPWEFGTPLEAFHARNQERLDRWPGSLLTTSTHDTKRSEDVRCRLHVLSEIPERWLAKVERWAKLNAVARSAQVSAPSRNDEYLFYQSLVGIWPMKGKVSTSELEDVRGRLVNYMRKAIREAREHSSWLHPNEAYEQAVTNFVTHCLSVQRSPDFLREVEDFVRQISRAGQLNSLALMVLKLASPGVADVYQGSELWDLSLVDPDNRRPVDFRQRAEMLRVLDEAKRGGKERLCQQLWEHPDDGRIKLYVLTEGLRFRRAHSELFTQGSYRPLDVLGPSKAHVVALARSWKGQHALALVPRWTGSLPSDSWRETFVEVPGEWANEEFGCLYSGKKCKPEMQGRVARFNLHQLWTAFPVTVVYNTPR